LSMTHDVDWIFCSHLISMKIYKTSSKRPRNPSFRVHPRNTGWGWGKITLGKQPCFSFSQSIEFYRFNNLEGKAPPLTYLKSYNMGFQHLLSFVIKKGKLQSGNRTVYPTQKWWQISFFHIDMGNPRRRHCIIINQPWTAHPYRDSTHSDLPKLPTHM
jgi:hypothetical protein